MLKNYTKVKVDGNKFYLNDEGKLHRLDGAAFEYTDGSKFWLVNGIYHRNIDPSVEYSNGDKYWSFNGEPHRVGGSFYSYSEFWRIHNKEYTKQDYFNKVWDI